MAVDEITQNRIWEALWLPVRIARRSAATGKFTPALDFGDERLLPVLLEYAGNLHDHRGDILLLCGRPAGPRIADALGNVAAREGFTVVRATIEEIENAADEFTDPDILILDIGKTARPRAIYELLEDRFHLGKSTWITADVGWTLSTAEPE